jgi:hypothetical protein
MGKISLGWPISGAVIGAVGFAFDLFTLSAIMNGVDVGRGWVTLAAILCPWCLVLRNMWCILALNCILYALLFFGLRFSWVRLSRRQEISN